VETKPLSSIFNVLVTCKAWHTFFESLSCFWAAVFSYMKIPTPSSSIGNNFWKSKQHFLPFLGFWSPAKTPNLILRSDVTISFAGDACHFSLHWELYQSSCTSQGGSYTISIRNAECSVHEEDSTNILRCEGTCWGSSDDDYGAHDTGSGWFILKIERTSSSEILLHFTQGCTYLSWEEYQSPHVWKKF
jgi:hypothetical protein